MSKTTQPRIDKKEAPSPLFDAANTAWEAGDAQRAFALFLAAARNGETHAFNSVGYFHDHGIGVKRDAASAYVWYRRAARRGDLAAYLNLAACFHHAGNLRRAKFWLKKAYAIGDGAAAYALGKIYMEQRSNTSRRHARPYLCAAVASKYISAEERAEAQALLAKLDESRPTLK